MIGPTTRVRSIAKNPVSCKHARDLCRREKLNSARSATRAINDKRAHYPAGPQGAMQGHSFKGAPDAGSWFRTLVISSVGGIPIFRSLLCLLGMINIRGNELTVLSMVNNTEARKCRISNPLLIFKQRSRKWGASPRQPIAWQHSEGEGASTAVRKLEEDLVNVSGFCTGTTRSVQLTEDGRGYFMHVPAICLLTLMICTQCSQAIEWALRGSDWSIFRPQQRASTIVPALPAFMATHPELELEVSSTDRQVDLVLEGFDCVFRLGPIGDETLIARPLGKLRMVIAASPAYLARYARPSIARRFSATSGTSGNSFFDDVEGARPY